jgi:hypothetical protein
MKENNDERYGSWMATYSGLQIYPLDPRENEISIQDIAHSLSMQCRFNGHVKRFYSVADHCIKVSNLCSDENKLWGLLHDASEGYLSDMPSPIKRHMDSYKSFENNMQKVICSKFGLSIDMPKQVHHFDLVLRSTEMRDLMDISGLYFGEGIEPLKEVLSPLTQEEAEQQFLELFYNLTGNK